MHFGGALSSRMQACRTLAVTSHYMRVAPVLPTLTAPLRLGTLSGVSLLRMRVARTSHVCMRGVQHHQVRSSRRGQVWSSIQTPSLSSGWLFRWCSTLATCAPPLSWTSAHRRLYRCTWPTTPVGTRFGCTTGDQRIIGNLGPGAGVSRDQARCTHPRSPARQALQINWQRSLGWPPNSSDPWSVESDVRRRAQKGGCLSGLSVCVPVCGRAQCQWHSRQCAVASARECSAAAHSQRTA